LPEGANLVPQLDHSSPVNFLLFSPHGSRIALGDEGRSIKLWDAASGRLLRTFAGHGNSVFSVAFSPE
jgi:WD40 repeat protein